MKQTPISFFSLAVAALVATPMMAWADARPDFDNDAKPILSQQPGLVEYVESKFEVKDTGTAKFPGDDDHAPRPPFIFQARPMGSTGPYNLRLLIQPGPPGHILGIVKYSPTSSSTQPPVVAAKSPATNQAAPANPPAPATQTPATSQPPSTPTSDTPSGPITDSSKTAAPAPTSPNLVPPPDPPPAPH